MPGSGDFLPILEGWDANGSNTGIAARGLTPDDLTTVGGTTYNSPQTVYRKRFTGQVNVNAPVEFIECMSVAQGNNMMCFRLNPGAVGTKFKWCTISPPVGASAYEGVLSSTADVEIYRCDFSGCENIITFDTQCPNITESYLHDPREESNPDDGHKDILEGFADEVGESMVVRTKISFPADETAPINLATWGGPASIDGITFLKCHIDGGVSHIIIDVQNAEVGGHIRNIRVKQCTAGGHTWAEYGRYRMFQNNDGRAVVETLAAQALNPDALYFPTLNADASHWRGCDDLVPNRSGQVIIP